MSSYAASRPSQFAAAMAWVFVVTHLMLQFFTWDDAKSEANRRKHGVSFAAARLVFDDPLHISRQDQIVDGEVRWQTTGWAEGMVLLLVAHTWHEAGEGVEHIRIVSARPATRLERKIYEEGP